MSYQKNSPGKALKQPPLYQHLLASQSRHEHHIAHLISLWQSSPHYLPMEKLIQNCNSEDSTTCIVYIYTLSRLYTTDCVFWTNKVTIIWRKGICCKPESKILTKHKTWELAKHWISGVRNQNPPCCNIRMRFILYTTKNNASQNQQCSLIC